MNANTASARGWSFPIVLLTVLVSQAVHAGTSVGSENTAVAGNLSESRLRGLQAVASLHPCAAVALLLMRHYEPKSERGTFYLQAIPSAQIVAKMQADPDGSALDGWAGALQLNPYTDATLLVEVRWTFTRLSESAAIFTARSQLVDGGGAPLRPVHLAEYPVSVLVKADTLQVLANSQAQ